MSALRRRARVHRAHEDRQVRRLLPRARRPPARPGGLGRRDARPPRLARRHAGSRRRHARLRPYNDLDAVARALRGARRHRGGHRRAGRREHGPRPPARRASSRGSASSRRAHGALLVFDEVMTGFRVHPGGAQALYGVTPDLTTLGKVIGGGLPVGAYGGRREIMELVAPAGPVYQAGTLSGQPARDDRRDRDAARARRARRLGRSSSAPAQRLDAGLGARCGGVACRLARAGTMFGLFFSDAPVTSWETARRADTTRFAASIGAMLERGVYLAPSQFEAGFLSTAHGDAEIDATIAAARGRVRSADAGVRALPFSRREGAPRDDVLPARRRRRRAALAQARAVPARARRSRRTCSRPTTRSGCIAIPSSAFRRRRGSIARATSARGRASRPRSCAPPTGSTARSSRRRSPRGACSCPTRASRGTSRRSRPRSGSRDARASTR